MNVCFWSWPSDRAVCLHAIPGHYSFIRLSGDSETLLISVFCITNGVSKRGRCCMVVVGRQALSVPGAEGIGILSVMLELERLIVLNVTQMRS